MPMPGKAENKIPILTFTDVSKIYDYGTHSLRKVNLSIHAGEFVFVCGKTGSGKSTLLRLITRELEPTGGKIEFMGQDIAGIRYGELPYYRRQVGVIRQGIGLFLEDKTAAENLEFVMRATGHEENTLQERAQRALSMVGLGKKSGFLVTDLSVGERKRVEIARALLNSPKMIIADEPTASLDRDLAWDIMSLFDDINRLGVTILVVTHDREMVNLMRKRVLTFSNGKLLGDVKSGRYGDLV